MNKKVKASKGVILWTKNMGLSIYPDEFRKWNSSTRIDLFANGVLIGHIKCHSLTVATKDNKKDIAYYIG